MIGHCFDGYYIISTLCTIGVLAVLIFAVIIIMNELRVSSEEACLSLGNGTNITNNCCFIENGSIGMSVRYQAVKCDELIKNR